MDKRQERNDLLRGVDLEAYFDMWYPTGQQRRKRAWHCPVHDGQSGRTPPVTIKTDDRGIQHWRCWSCQAKGTAIDLVMVKLNCNVAQAFDELSGRTSTSVMPAVPRVVGDRPRQEYADKLVPEALAHLKACRDRLWTPGGDKGRSYLRERCLWDEALIKINGLGYDPGHWRVPRPDNLHKGEAITWPVLDLDGRVVTYQVRQLWRKAVVRWLSASSEVGPRQPAVTYVAVPNADPDRPLLICEGLSDSLTAGRCGFRAMGAIGTAAMVDPRLADAVQAACDKWGQRRVLVCGDNDKAGRPFNEVVEKVLQEAGIDATIFAPPPAHKDLNDWLCADGVAAVSAALIEGARAAPQVAGATPAL